MAELAILSLQFGVQYHYRYTTSGMIIAREQLIVTSTSVHLEVLTSLRLLPVIQGYYPPHFFTKITGDVVIELRISECGVSYESCTWIYPLFVSDC